jgi:hypothetical protein
MKTVKTRRNDPCPCGSGKKFKICCEGKAEAKSKVATKWTAAIVGAIVVIGALMLFSSISTDEGSATAQPGRVWSPEHGHYH